VGGGEEIHSQQRPTLSKLKLQDEEKEWSTMEIHLLAEELKRDL
jgi:hypothetical protein